MQAGVCRPAVGYMQDRILETLRKIVDLSILPPMALFIIAVAVRLVSGATTVCTTTTTAGTPPTCFISRWCRSS